MTDATVPSLNAEAGVQLPDWIVSLSWRADSGMVAVACADGTIHELLPDGTASAQVGYHEGGASAVAYSLRGVLATAGADGRVGIGTVPPQLTGAGWVDHLMWSPDGTLLASAIGRRLQLWTDRGEMVTETPPFPATIECLAWSPDSTRLAGGGHGGITLCARDGIVLGASLQWTGVVLALAWAPGGQRLACGMQDHAVWLWDVDAQRAATMDGMARKVRELAWSVDGRWLVTGGGTVPVAWHYGDGGIASDQQIELRGHEKPVVWAGFQPRGPLLATAAEDGLAVLWALPGFRPLTGATVGEEVGACSWSPDGTRLALGGASGRVAVFALQAAD